MTDPVAPTLTRPNLTAIEPAARAVPVRALRRVIRACRDRGDFDTHVLHTRSWWVNRDRLFSILTPWELGLSPTEPATDLLLLPEENLANQSPTALWRTIFHAGVDRQVDLAIAGGRVSPEWVRDFRQRLGPAQWHEIRVVLEGEQLTDDHDTDLVVFREFAAFALEVRNFLPGEWLTYFPGLQRPETIFAAIRKFVDVDALLARTKPPGLLAEPALSRRPPDPPVPSPATGRAPEAVRARAQRAAVRGNDLRAAILLARAGDPSPRHHPHQLMAGVRAVAGERADNDAWKEALAPLLAPATSGGWTVERRLLYELQRACLAVERQAYAADLVEWAITFGRKPIKRPLTKPIWLPVTPPPRTPPPSAARFPP